MRRRPLSKWIASLNNLSCDLCCPIQSYPSFPTVILVLEAGYLRVTHPFAMVLLPFDLHVLGTPPALILSQDQTLQKIYLLFCFFSFLLLFFFRIALLFASSFFISSYTVFKDLNWFTQSTLVRVLFNNTIIEDDCQYKFYLFLLKIHRLNAFENINIFYITIVFS